MTSIFVVFAVALAISLVGSRLAILLSNRLGLVEMPDRFRRRHKGALPRLGGVPIFVAFFASMIFIASISERSNVGLELVTHWGREIVGLFACASLALLLGLLDDRFELNAGLKLLGQIAIALTACRFGYVMRSISNPFGGGPLVLGVFSWPVSVFWFVACMNAVNLIDGMDGLAAGICLFVGLTLFVLCLEEMNIVGLVVIGCFTGATLGFLFWNFPPARIFLGNSGSTLLGFLVASLSFISLRKAEAALALFIPVVALGLPFFDTFMAVIRRWYRGLPMSTPDREHIHHVLVSFGLSHRRTVLVLYAVCVVLGLAAFLLTIARSELAILIVVLLTLMVYVAMRVFGGIGLREVIERFQRDNTVKRRSAEMNMAVNQLIGRFAHAPNLDALWTECLPVFEDLELTAVGIEIPSPAEEGNAAAFKREWRSERTDSDADVLDKWSASLALSDEGVLMGRMAVEQRTRSHLMIPQMSDLLDRLRVQLAVHIRRLAG